MNTQNIGAKRQIPKSVLFMESMMRIPKINAKILILLSFFSSLAPFSEIRAMDFSTEASAFLEKGQTVLRAEGMIIAGDASKLRAHLQESPPSTDILLITSPGGHVQEAIKIAEIVQENSFSVVVMGECASACAMIIFPAGEYSILTSGSLLGIHSCSNSGERNDLCNSKIAEYATSNGFPYGTIDLFSDLYGPGEMKWMTEISARCFGFYRGLDDPKPIHGKKACVDGYIFTLNTSAKPRPFGPSFDCREASTNIERLFCLDKELMQSDSILGRVYDYARSGLSNKDMIALRRTQKQWIEERNKSCKSLIGTDISFRNTRDGALCLYRFNEDRIYELIEFSK